MAAVDPLTVLDECAQLMQDLSLPYIDVADTAAALREENAVVTAADEADAAAKIMEASWVPTVYEYTLCRAMASMHALTSSFGVGMHDSHH